MRPRLGDGNSFSTAYSVNFTETDLGERIALVDWVNPNSWYWRERSARASRKLREVLTDFDAWEAFWDTVPDDATAKQIAQMCESHRLSLVIHIPHLLQAV